MRRTHSHTLLRDLQQISHWIGVHIHSWKAQDEPRTAFDWEPIFLIALPLAVIIALQGAFKFMVGHAIPVGELDHSAMVLTNAANQPSERVIGHWYREEMPDRSIQWARFKGTVMSYSHLPREGNSPLDELEAADTSAHWIWMAIPGTPSFAWVDP